MSAFEDFIQRELPKRGYLDQDPAQETVIVRRGLGPRQFDVVTLAEGEVLARVNGVLTGVTLGDLGGAIRKATFTASTPSVIWLVQHNLGSEEVIIQIFDETKSVIIPDSMRVVDGDLVEVRFSSPQTGIARILFLD